MFEGFKRHIMYYPDGGGSGAGSAASNNAATQATTSTDEGGDPALTYEGWLSTQPENVRTMLSENERGLRAALQNERKSRSDLEKQLREVAGKASPETQQQLTQLADQLGEAERRASFYDAAHAEGVTNLKLAYMVAAADGLIDKQGRVDFKTLKTSYPELFKQPTARPAPGNAGTGSDNAPGARSMNDWIRNSAGVKPQ